MVDWLVLNGMPREEVERLSPPRDEDLLAEHQFKPDITLHGGETLKIGRFTFDVIWTPGHSPGHICLHEAKERILVSGDHILPVITPSINYHPELMGNPLQTFLNSLRSLAQLDISLVLPAHEQPFNDLRKRIAEIEQHHRNRCDEILAALDGPIKSAYEISSEITWADGQMQWADMPQFHRMLAIGETIAHLYFMLSQGTAEIASNNGRRLWARTAPSRQ